ncbi:hypothetical protein ACFYZJ_09955 [Streptomyces sp. NPDC001848]|uniref:hypothetical protein n=1 Tax=Streptomyces sp. NPDC001848 TaxID=3364618 RepID=UPI003683B3CF
MPAHVTEHYAALTVEELTESVLGHYERLRPRVAELIAAHADEDGTGPGLVLEGSALLPDHVARLPGSGTGSGTVAVWLTADVSVVRARVYAAGQYDAATPSERLVMDKFVARSERFQSIVLDAVDRLGLTRLDVGGGRPVGEVADAVLDAVGVRDRR